MAAYTWRFPGALEHNYNRYLYVLIPFAVLGWANMLSLAQRRVRPVSRWLAALTLGQILLLAPITVGFYVDEARSISRENAEMARWVARSVPRDAVVLIHDAGRIARTGQQPLVDMVGLKSQSRVDVHQRAAMTQCRQSPPAIAEIAAHAGATYMVVTRDWDATFGLSDALRTHGWKVERADGQRGNTLYRVYRIYAPERQLTG